MGGGLIGDVADRLGGKVDRPPLRFRAIWR